MGSTLKWEKLRITLRFLSFQMGELVGSNKKGNIWGKKGLKERLKTLSSLYLVQPCRHI